MKLEIKSERMCKPSWQWGARAGLLVLAILSFAFSISLFVAISRLT
jgi:hypothetical protein